jgi:hypothetical protein
MTKNDLYAGLVRLCQEYGFTTDATYDLLHQAVESIVADVDEFGQEAI